MTEAPSAEKPPEEEASKSSARVGHMLYRLALAGVGGFMLAQEEISALFKKDAAKGTGPALVAAGIAKAAETCLKGVAAAPAAALRRRGR